MRRLPLALIAFLCLASASIALPAIPSPPAGSLPGMQSRARTLPAAVLVAEATDHAGLRRVLERGAYAGGNEREFYGKTAVFNHVTEQVLRFGDPPGRERTCAGSARTPRNRSGLRDPSPQPVSGTEASTTGRRGVGATPRPRPT